MDLSNSSNSSEIIARVASIGRGAVIAKAASSSSSRVSSSTDHSGHESSDEGKRHAEIPRVAQREERKVLLNPASQEKRPQPGTTQGKGESSVRGRPSEQSPTSSPPAIPPRNASLKSKRADYSQTEQVRFGDIPKTGGPSPQKKGGKGVPNTTHKQTNRKIQTAADFRNSLLAKDNGVAAIDEIKKLCSKDSIKDFSSKRRVVLGNTKWICAENVSLEENSKYFTKVWELYQLAEDDHKVVDRMRERIDEINKLKRRDHQKTAATTMVNLMMFRLTPNQRHQLRQEFTGLYFSETVNDNINWLFFDTIVRSTIMDDAKQKKLMLKLYQTPRDRPLKKREKLRDEILMAGYKIREKRVKEFRDIGDNRLEARDRMRYKLHGKMSKIQREELKKICKARYDELTNSKLPALHVLIREKNQEAMMAYMDKVLRYAPRAERARLLMARCDTSNGEETGDAAFFTLAHSGNVDMMGAYLERILNTSRLTVSQKSEVLKAFRFEDGMTPFHLMMSAGDWPRVNRFVRIIYKWKHAQDDYLCVSDDAEKATVYFTPTWTYPECTIADVIDDLLRAPVDDHTRPTRIRNAYTSAIELGKKKCARQFKKKMLHDRMKDLFYSPDLKNMTYYLPSDPKRNTKEQDEVIRAKAMEDKSLNDVLVLLDHEGKDPKKRNGGFRGIELAKNEPSEAKKIMDENPEIMRLTVREREKLKFKLYAFEKYKNVNIENLNALENLKLVKKRPRPSSQPDGSPSPARRKWEHPGAFTLNGLSRSFHSMPDLSNLPDFLTSPRPSPDAKTATVAQAPISPSSPYPDKKLKSSDEERLIETSESK